jgi:signal peptidase I
MLLDGDKSPASHVSAPHEKRKRRTTFVIVTLAGIFVAASYYFVPSIFSRRFPGVRILTTTAVSMAPTIRPGDRVLVNFAIYDVTMPKRGDIVVVDLGAAGEHLETFKRVMAVGGDEISTTPTSTIVNGQPLDESYVNRNALDENGKPIFGYQQEWVPIKVPADHFFLLGDNRMESYDSRHVGAVVKKQIEGKAVAIIRASDSTGAWQKIQ